MGNDLDIHVTAYEGNTSYEFDNRIMLQWYPKRILQMCRSHESLLELGLGHGYTTSIFSKHIKNHVALEGSSAVIRNFCKNTPDIKTTIVETFFEEYETDTKFDIIVLGFILEHVDDPCLILRKYAQYLAVGGQMFVAVPNALSMNRLLGNHAGFLDDMYALSQNDLDLGHKRLYSLERIRSEMESAGLRVGRVEGIYLKPFTTSQILSLHLDEKVIDGLCQLGVQYPELCCGILAEGTAHG